MKAAFIALLAFATSALALDISIPGDRTYRDCTNLRADKDILAFTHADGAARVPYEKLPSAMQSKFFDGTKIAGWQAERRAMEGRAAVAAAEAARQREAAEAARRELIATAAAEATRAKADAAAADAKKRAKAAAAEAENRRRLDNYRSGKWERFIATMVGPAEGGQIMRKPDGTTIYVANDAGIAQGEHLRGYFERDGNYEYTAAGGGAARVKKYVYRQNASHDMGEDLIELMKLKNAMMARKITREEIEKIADLEVRLRNEGESPILLQ